MAGAPEVEDWLDRERSRLARLAAGVVRAAPDPAPAPTPRADGPLLLICPFTVRGNAAIGYLAEGMVDLLATKLDGAGDLRVVEPRLALSGAANTGEAWDVSRGKWLAARAGAASFILGGVVEVAGRLEATAALHSADGALLARVDGRAEGEAGLFELVDQLARHLLAHWAGAANDRLTRLAALTTESLPALKAWLNGERAFRLARHLEAADAYRRATQADRSFALAWYRLAAAYAASALITPAREASAAAYRHRKRLSEHDRLLLEAQHSWITGQSGDAERRYAALVTAWPESLEAWFLLGDVQLHSNPYRGKSAVLARASFERAVELDPGHLGAIVQLARIAAMEGRGGDLDALVERALTLSPSGDQALGLRVLQAFSLGGPTLQAEVTRELAQARGLTIARAFSDVALYSGNLDGAERLGRELFAAARSEEFRAFGQVTLAHLDLARGRVVEAFDRLRQAERHDPAWALETRGLFAALPFLPIPPDRLAAVRAELTAWDPAAARPAVAIPLAFHNDLHAQLRVYLLGLLAVRAGTLEEAALAGEELAELPVPEGNEALLQHLGRTLHAALLQARGAPQEALAVLEQGRLDVWFQYAVASPFFAGTYERFLRAELLAAAGRLPDALQWWGAIAERSPFELPFLAASLERQRAIWRELGDTEQAGRAEERARVLWGNGPKW